MTLASLQPAEIAAAAFEGRPIVELHANPLAEALLRARESLSGVVFKGGTNSKQEYHYVGHEDVIRYARKALIDEGLVLDERAVTYRGAIKWQAKHGESSVLRWRGHFVLEHISGASRKYTFEATTLPSDKAAFIASTALDRTAILRVLQLAGSDTEDPEHDSNEERPQQQQNGAKGAAQAPAQERAAQRTQAAKSSAEGRKAELARLLEAMGGSDDPAQFVSYASWLLVFEASANEKKPAWDAFGARCRAVSLDPNVIVAQARAKGASRG